MVTTANQRARRVVTATRRSGTPVKQSSAVDPAGRLIQIALALYLIPALLIVLAVGGLGILVLGIGRLISGMATPSPRRL